MDCVCVRPFVVGTLLAIVVALSATAATGAPITYKFSGTASGTLNGTPFTGANVTATASGDTATITQPGAGSYCNDLGTVTIVIGGVGTVTTTAANLVFSNTGNQIWGFENGTCATSLDDWLDVTDPASASYHLDTAVGPTTGTPNLTNDVPTSGGTLRFTAVPTTFTAFAGTAATVAVPVPTLAPWSLAALALALTLAACASQSPRLRSRIRRRASSSPRRS